MYPGETSRKDDLGANTPEHGKGKECYFVAESEGPSIPGKAQVRHSSVLRSQMLFYSSFPKLRTHPLVATGNVRGYVQNKTSHLKPC